MSFTTIIKNNEPEGRPLHYLGGLFIGANDVLVLNNCCVPFGLRNPEQGSFYGELHRGAISVTYVTDLPTITPDKLDQHIEELRKTVKAPVNAVEVAPVLITKDLSQEKPQPAQTLAERFKPVELDKETATDALSEGALFKEGKAETFTAKAFAMTADDAESIKENQAIEVVAFDGVTVSERKNNNPSKGEGLISVVDPVVKRGKGKR